MRENSEVEKIRLLKKYSKNIKEHLIALTSAVTTCLQAFDEEMQKPSDVERGKRVAKICNILEMENDKARYFGLGIDYRRDKKTIFNTFRKVRKSDGG